MIRGLMACVGTTVLTSIALLGPSASASQAAPVVSGNAPATTTEAYEIQLRAEFGLPLNLVQLRQVDATSNDRTQLGIPLTAAETSEMQRRSQVYKPAVAIDAHLADNSDYGGVWIDQLDSGRLHITSVSILDPVTLSYIARTVPTGMAYTVDTVKRSLAALRGVQAAVSDDEQAWADKGITLGGVGVDVQHNDVAVAVYNGSADQISAIESAYPNLDVTRTTAKSTLLGASRSVAHGPLWPGQWLTVEMGTTNEGGCTVGFSNLLNTLGQHYAITAGHCGLNGWHIFRGYPTVLGVSYGDIHDGQVGPAGPNETITCDCAPIGPLASGWTDTVLVDNNAMSVLTGLSNVVAGQAVCQLGAASEEASPAGLIQCGTVTSAGYNAPLACDPSGLEACFFLRDAVQTTMHGRPGDSGATVDSAGSFVGLVSQGPVVGGVANNVVYSKASRIDDFCSCSAQF